MREASKGKKKRNDRSVGFFKYVQVPITLRVCKNKDIETLINYNNMILTQT